MLSPLKPINLGNNSLFFRFCLVVHSFLPVMEWLDRPVLRSARLPCPVTFRTRLSNKGRRELGRFWTIGDFPRSERGVRLAQMAFGVFETVADVPDRVPAGARAAQPILHSSPLLPMATCRGQCSQRTLPQTTIPENIFQNVLLVAFDRTNDYHP